MGMAASQARFLGITARKNNVEYEGQQINQQRTALGNQSAGLFNQMLGLKVPSPPDISKFMADRYVFKDGDRNFEVRSGLGNETSMIREKYVVNEMRSQPTNSGLDVTISLSASDKNFYLNGKLLTKLQDPQEQIRRIYEENNDPKLQFVLNGGVNLSQADWSSATKAEKDAYISNLDMSNPNNVLYSYVNNGITTFVQGAYIEEKPTGDYSINIPQEFYDHSFSQSQDINFTNCIWQTDASGRYTQMTGIPSGETKNRTFDLTFIQVKDDLAFDNAMNDYVYQKSLYDKSVADINAKTEIIQAQDRTLELRLKQLDTEQKALQTESDAVKKVVDKNVESSFKTFG